MNDEQDASEARFEAIKEENEKLRRQVSENEKIVRNLNIERENTIDRYRLEAQKGEMVRQQQKRNQRDEFIAIVGIILIILVGAIIGPL